MAIQPPAEQSPFSPCPACGAQRVPQARFCWLCGAPLPAADDAPVVAELVESQRPGWTQLRDPWLLHASIWAGVILAFVVGFGVVQADAKGGLAVVYVVAVVPALVFTIAGSALGRLAGRPWDPGKKVLAFMSVFGMTVAITLLVMALIVISAIIAFFQMCFGGGR